MKTNKMVQNINWKLGQHDVNLGKDKTLHLYKRNKVNNNKDLKHIELNNAEENHIYRQKQKQLVVIFKKILLQYIQQKRNPVIGYMKHNYILNEKITIMI